MYSFYEYPYLTNRKSHTKNLPELKRGNLFKTVFETIIQCCRDFCLYTTIHGFNHIAVPGRHWVERLLWMCITVAAVWGAMGVSLGQISRYEKPTVVTLEKDFRNWLFNMPAVTTCDINRVDSKKLDKVLTKYFSVDHHDEKYDYYKRFVSTVANSDILHLEGFAEFVEDEELDNVGMFQLAIDVMPQLQVKATWSHGHEVKWVPVMTESGACYVANSIALADSAIVKLNVNDTKMFPLTCKYSSLRCYVLMEIEEEANFYLHSPYDIADTTASATRIYASLDKTIELSVMETACGNGIRELSPQRRGCLYNDEPVKTGRKVYSTNTCRLSCRSKLAVKLCGCRPFYYLHEDGPVCSPRGMHCLAKNAHLLITNGGVKCACSPQCLDAVYRDVATSEQIWTKGQFADRGSIRYAVQPPRSRYTREIVFYFQDLVVSFGGAAGLFLGASFISFVEIIYFLLERIFKVFVGDTKKEVAAKWQPPNITYEAARIMELNNILNNQKKYRYSTVLVR